MSDEHATTLGLLALGWLAQDVEFLSGFMAATGSDADSLRAAATSRSLLISLLDFILQDDQRVIGFADANGLDYQTPMLARAVLAGEAGRNWT